MGNLEEKIERMIKQNWMRAKHGANMNLNALMFESESSMPIEEWKVAYYDELEDKLKEIKVQISKEISTKISNIEMKIDSIY